MMNSELSGLGDASLEKVVLETFEKAGLRIDGLLQALNTKLDAQHQTLLVSQSGCRQAILTKLDMTQQQLVTTREDHDRSLKSIQRTQVDIVGRQERTTRLVQRTQNQTGTILRTVKRAGQGLGRCQSTFTLAKWSHTSKKEWTRHLLPRRTKRPDHGILASATR
jgi:hypothetical protein